MEFWDFESDRSYTGSLLVLHSTRYFAPFLKIHLLTFWAEIQCHFSIPQGQSLVDVLIMGLWKVVMETSTLSKTLSFTNARVCCRDCLHISNFAPWRIDVYVFVLSLYLSLSPCHHPTATTSLVLFSRKIARTVSPSYFFGSLEQDRFSDT